MFKLFLLGVLFATPIQTETLIYGEVKCIHVKREKNDEGETVKEIYITTKENIEVFLVDDRQFALEDDMDDKLKRAQAKVLTDSKGKFKFYGDFNKNYRLVCCVGRYKTSHPYLIQTDKKEFINMPITMYYYE